MVAASISGSKRPVGVRSFLEYYIKVLRLSEIDEIPAMGRPSIGCRHRARAFDSGRPRKPGQRLGAQSDLGHQNSA